MKFSLSFLTILIVSGLLSVEGKVLGDGQGLLGGPGVAKRIEDAKAYIESKGGIAGILKKNAAELTEWVKTSSLQIPSISLDDLKKALSKYGLGDGGKDAKGALQALVNKIGGSEIDLDITNVIEGLDLDGIASGKVEIPAAMGKILTIGLLVSGEATSLDLQSILGGGVAETLKNVKETVTQVSEKVQKVKDSLEKEGGIGGILKKNKDQIVEWVKESGIEIPKLSVEDLKKALESHGLKDGKDVKEALKALIHKISGSDDHSIDDLIDGVDLEAVVKGEVEIPPALGTILTLGLMASGEGANLQSLLS